MNHMLSAKDIGTEKIKFLLDSAAAFSSFTQKGEIIPLLRGQTLVMLFERSVQTRSSFEIAIKRLEGSETVLTHRTTLTEVVNEIRGMRAHGLIVRQLSAGSPYTLASLLNIPVINAGDGVHEHPTQGLIDAFTIQGKLGNVEGKRILILGDIASSRVARSDIHVLKALGARVTICAPPTLMPAVPELMGVDYVYKMEEFLPIADVVMALPLQAERDYSQLIPSLAEYAKFWGLNRERASLLPKTALIFHPGPPSKGVALDPEVIEGTHSVIMDQAFNGILVRMAVLADACNPLGLRQFLEEKGKPNA